MALLSLASLLVTETKAALYAKALEVAEYVGLPVSAWEAGDPTRSNYHALSEMLETAEEAVAQYCAAGFLDFAAALPTTSWLVILADQVYGVTANEATFATCTVRLTNGGGGLYESGDIIGAVVKNTSTGKTYRVTTGGTLDVGPATTLDVTVIADEAGSDSSAAIGEIDDLVTDLLGVTCSNTTAAVGLDAESAASIVERCRDKLGSLSPDGPRDAYTYVARTSSLTGRTEVTRARSYGDSDTGDVTLYLAGAAGAVSSEVVDAVEDAIIEWATPLCITPTVASCTAVAVPVTYTLWLYSGVSKTATEVQDAVGAALDTLFASRPIGGDIIPPATSGTLYRTLIESTIRGVFPNHAFRVSVTAPAGDTALTVSQVATKGAVTPTITFVEDP